MIAASRRGTLVRVARLKSGRLADFTLWRLDAPDGVGDVYTGRVDAVLPALAGSFVALTPDLSGFLPDNAGGRGLTEGTYLTVRVTRSPQGGKGPRLAAIQGQPGPTPGLISRGPGPLLDLAASHPGDDIIIDDYELIAQLRPQLEGRMGYAREVFDTQVEDEIAALHEPIADLPFGARLHITPAPAATLLDIDAGSASATPPMALNLSLIPALCRQIRLRNLSGAILIDFAGLKAAQRLKLTAPLQAALSADPQTPRLLGFSHHGFAEITRPRLRPPLHELLTP